MPYLELYIIFGFFFLFFWGLWIVYKGKARMHGRRNFLYGTSARLFGCIVIIMSLIHVLFWSDNEYLLLIRFISGLVAASLLITIFGIEIYNNFKK